MARPLPETFAERSALREALIARGYADDGDLLYGRIGWTDAEGVARRTAITIELEDSFPFAPPVVRLDPDAAGSDVVTSTFHLENVNKLCLWDRDTVVEGAAWRDADSLLAHVAGWFAQAAAGWPGDEDCDLERYLSPAGRFITYDSSELATVTGNVATSRTPILTHVTARMLPAPKPGSRAPRSQRRDRRAMAWVGDLGPVHEPIRGWSDLSTHLTDPVVEQHVRGGNVDLLLLRYMRGTAHGVLAVHAEVTPTGIEIRGCECADVSLATRTLRAGAPAELLSKQNIAIVGCGAIGGFIADLLFRAGARRITLIDPQRLRPGNLVRHVAAAEDIGKAKVVGVLNHLARTGLPIGQVKISFESIDTLRDAMDLVRDHSVVIDASADARATSLLRFAAEDREGRLISTCLQREGGIARVDRWPLLAGERHLAAVPEIKPDGVRERGCGDLVSLTPPHSVTFAANLTIEVLLDQLSACPQLPPTRLEVLGVQPDAPYDRVGPLATVRGTASAA
jgi:hypothetical protein